MNKTSLEGYKNNLKNRLYKLLCEREEGGKWLEFLNNIIIELLGYPEEKQTINYYRLMFKISSLRYLDWKYFRSTIFECINLVEEVKWTL